eukprot:CAMPEP_0172418598 /NCGR_PEP_ID=MMETSP1064-20121228/5061_1 /TAXON_ID=202472 /ORGANISM="Aulacoseira subarctica , Strain CCAP 1002/5" /LENGTH=302 /DNA_ID=CAMNT_0013157589 /DNA_START=1150 /DNA_END=2058 /DNA_ORIENTATION=+
MIYAAKEAELQERKIIYLGKCTPATRRSNMAIQSRASVERDVLLKKIPASRIQDYVSYPLTSQLGFIPAIPEDKFDISQATITDVGFLGMFPKSIFQVRPISIQKVIHILLSAYKQHLNNLDEQRLTEDIQETTKEPQEPKSTASPTPLELSNSSKTTSITMTPNHKCYANKCQLLQARGILRRRVPCIKGRNTCSGCSIEAGIHRKVLQIEAEILALSITNDTLIPLLQYRTKPTSIKTFRKLLSCLPSFAKTSRNDYIYGAARYLANTLGILLGIHPMLIRPIILYHVFLPGTSYIRNKP